MVCVLPWAVPRSGRGADLSLHSLSARTAKKKRRKRTADEEEAEKHPARLLEIAQLTPAW
jgi:hypothetical protein